MSETAPLQLDLFSGEPAAPRPAEAADQDRTPDRRAEPAPAGKSSTDAERRKRELFSRGRELKERLQRLASGQLRSVTLTDNRTRIVSARPAPSGALDVRIHRCFVDAPEATLRAVATLLFSRRRGRARRQALQVIREHFDRHRPAAPAAAHEPRRLTLRPVGHCFDLRQLRDAVNRRYFDEKLDVHITWGRHHAPGPARRGRSRRRRGCGFSIQLGSWDERRQVVRIHRCLDRPEVPRYVVESVVHHEMLHAAIPAVVVNGRRRVHTPEFRRRERLFHDYERASRWIEEHLQWLAEVRSGNRKRR